MLIFFVLINPLVFFFFSFNKDRNSFTSTLPALEKTMRKELTLKQDDFWRLLAREQFLWQYFNARLRYRIRTYLS